jgi:hypothetical protein
MYQIIERCIDKSSRHFGKEFIIYECDDREEAERGCDTWRKHSSPGFSHEVVACENH